MQLLDRNNLNFELKLDSLEDLWVLSQFICEDDKIFATTQRKVSIGSDKKKQVTKIIFVELKVKKVNFDSETLRISGEIENETEFTAKKQAHTLSFNVNDKIKIEKKSLLVYEENLIRKAVESKSQLNLLVLLDKDELLAIEFSDYSYKVFFHEKGLGSKKYHKLELNEEEEKLKIIEDLLKKNYSSIIFSGPGIYKEKLKKYIIDKLGIKILTFNWHDVNENSISKLVKDISTSGMLSESQLAIESKFIQKLLENIAKNEKNSYGIENTKNAINMGSVESLLISTKLIDDKKEEGTYLKLNELMKLSESLQAKLVILNSRNDSGKILDGLGGIGAILRY